MYEVTFNMPYQFAMAYANILSLHTPREDLNNKNSLGHMIANVNFLRRQRTYVEDSAYAHLTDFLICTFEYQLHYITL